MASEYYNVSWDIFPKPGYLKDRFLDVYNRYGKIIKKSPFPSLFENKELIKRLETNKSQLDGDLQLSVISRDDVRLEDLIPTSNPGQRHQKSKGGSSLFHRLRKQTSMKEGSNVVVAICYKKIKKFDSKEEQAIVELVEHYSSIKEKEGLAPELFIVCHLKASAKSDERIREQFRSNLLTTLGQKFNLTLETENFMIGFDKGILSSKIASCLETKIAEGIISLGQHIETLFRNHRGMIPDDFDITESEEVLTAIQGFVKNGLAFVDMIENKGSESFMDMLLNNLARVLRCATMKPLSMKCNLSEAQCNTIAHEANLETLLIEAISANTRYHLGNLEKPCQAMYDATKRGDTSHKFGGSNFLFTAYPIRSDIQKAFQDFEKKLEGLKTLNYEMKKMLFEIKGYIKQHTKKMDVLVDDLQPNIPDDLRKAILRLDKVYGMGTIFEEIQIHVEADVKDMRSVEEAISDTTVEYNFKLPYRVARILQKPKLLGYETGTSIVCDQSGTLGWILRGRERLYGITSAHVVGGERVNEREVYISEAAQQKRLFGKSQPNMTVMDDEDGSSIDIAAVKVEKDVENNCSLSLKNEDESESPAQLYTQTLSTLYDRHPVLYKFGAKSGLTKGLICSKDYSVKNAERKTYTVLIEALAGMDEQEYAKEGDSGAINCFTNLGTNGATVIEATSMLSSGGLKVEGNASPYYLSFMLNIALDKLNEVAGGNEVLNIPTSNN